jgi:hypothetical protein
MRLAAAVALVVLVKVGKAVRWAVMVVLEYMFHLLALIMAAGAEGA